jgi:hypothetical protein
MKSIDDSFYVLDIPVQELRGFNVVFPKIARDRDFSERTTRKVLSGIRSKVGAREKVSKREAQIWLRHWHRLGLVTRIHGRVRLGSPSVYAGVLDDKNKALMRKSLE